MYEEPYDESKETVKEYVRRHLMKAMSEELKKDASRILYGKDIPPRFPILGILGLLRAPLPREEFRCTEETALKLKEVSADKIRHDTMQSYFALGIPVLVRDDVPSGKLQFWRDDKMIKEIDV